MATPSTTQAKAIFDAYLQQGDFGGGDVLGAFGLQNGLTATDLSFIRSSFAALDPSQTTALIALQIAFGSIPWATATASSRSAQIAALAAKFVSNPPTRATTADGGKTTANTFSGDSGTLITWAATSGNLQ